ncbi:FemAB-related protein, PEP-CTERM system-associated [Luteitalea pratensis]|uniref:FemAB-related protein, PEP-CTERM system-associated n=1 Tax=Luteitalea pratensis TaxID=1855912 RepID=A0A143PW53_LUTPR|nr:GNAT family N-acetyltransferase [Luteitalea pratensis]AMY12987.1 FemAB-related protein, PEP-CTERM system-associated [Luteitalea pratensis]
MTSLVRVIDPLADPRWPELVASHPNATIFHSRGWLDALRRTYGYEPFALTTTAQGRLENGLVACRVNTWLVRRLVSLPFSDHCDPLVSSTDEATALGASLSAEMTNGKWRTLEIRTRTVSIDLPEGETYALHTLDLDRAPDRMFASFHASNTRRAVRRAEREGVTYESGRTDSLLNVFYGLLRLTRRRHGTPPQPLSWFRNLSSALDDQLTVHVARKASRPIATLLTLRFGASLVYKYGGSDARYHSLGGMPFLFWQVIQRAHADGVKTFDLGRSDLDQAGLIAFKDHLGARSSRLTYRVVPAPSPTSSQKRALVRLARKVIASLPDPALDFTGRIAYRHLG